MQKIKISDKLIGEGEPCFIIAEAGVNHNGKLKLAKELIDVAVEAKADAVKFQTFRAEDVTIKKTEMATYQRKNIGKNQSQYEMIKKLELTLDDFRRLKEYCDDKHINFLTSLGSDNGIIDFIDRIVPAFKIGSGDLTNHPFLKKIAQKKKPMIVSSGMATMEEVKEAKRAIEMEGNQQIIFLHATTNYPCPLNEVNLNAMKTIEKELNCLIGYSDHTMGLTVPIMAVTLGAVVIEKHFTLNRNLQGPDHKASLEPNELKKMVTEIRNVEIALGNNEKKPTESEKEIMKVVRKSIIAKKDITKGTTISEGVLTYKRPGTGISPSKVNEVFEKKSLRNIRKDEIIKFWMLE